MSIKIGPYNSILSIPKGSRTFNNERIKVNSDVQSNLIEIGSSCDKTSISIQDATFGSSNKDSYFLDGTITYPVKYVVRVLDIASNISNIKTKTVDAQGSLNIYGNINSFQNITNYETSSINVVSSNISIYTENFDETSFFITSNSTAQIYYNSAENNSFLIHPNVGIGTTISKYKIYVQGGMFLRDGMYTPSISSNISSRPIIVLGNLDIKGGIFPTEPFDFQNTPINVERSIITNTNYEITPAIEINQRSGGRPFSLVNILNNDSKKTIMYGIMSDGRTYVGRDISGNNRPSIFTISLPASYSNDHEFRAISHNTSNEICVSSNAYYGIGTITATHPIHLQMQSNTNMLNNPMSNNSTLGMYHVDMPNKPFIAAYSNNIRTASIDISRNLSIGPSNNSIIYENGNITNKGTIYCNNLSVYNNIVLPPILNININNLTACNILVSGILSRSMNVCNLTVPITSVLLDINTSNSYISDTYITSNTTLSNMILYGTIDGPNVKIFSGISTPTYFIPMSSGTGSMSVFKSSNILVSVNNDYTSELAGAINGGSNGVLQIRTYDVSYISPISSGISIYGHDRSSSLVTAQFPYYQLKKSNENAYNMYINSANEFVVGLSNSVLATEYTLSMLRITTDSIIAGNSKTFLYTRANASVLVAPTYDPALAVTGGFEVKGLSYFRTETNIPIMFMNDLGRVGVGNTTPIKTLDVVGQVDVSQRVGIGTTLPRTSLDANGAVRCSLNITTSNMNQGCYGCFSITNISYSFGDNLLTAVASTTVIPNGITVSSGIFTVSNTGTYSIRIRQNINSQTGPKGGELIFSLNVNGTPIQRSLNYRDNNELYSDYDDITGTFVTSFPANGQFSITLTKNSIGTITCNNTQQNSRIMIFKIG